MTILHSCCCWRSVRKGSYASAAYTFVYFSITGTMLAGFLHRERLYLSGETAAPESFSFLEEEISKTTLGLHIVLVVLSTLGMLSAILLAIGLYKDIRALLLPWIYVLLTDILVEFGHCIYLVIQETVEFHPITGVLYTADFFLLCLNIYSLLCVISQYQEYKAGRGTASEDFDHTIPSLRLQYLSHHNPSIAANPASARSLFHAGSAAESQIHAASPPAKIKTAVTGKSPDVEPQSNGQWRGYRASHRRGSSRKKVKFPDESTVAAPDMVDEPSTDMALHVETVCISTSEPSCIISQWNSSQLLPVADEEPLLQHSPDENIRIELENK